MSAKAKAAPFVSGIRFRHDTGGGVEFSSIGLQLDAEHLACVLDCKPAQLRALVHDDDLYVGCATGEQPLTSVLCPRHPIVLRGPTIWLPLRPRKRHEAGLTDVLSAEPATKSGLAAFKEHIMSGEPDNGTGLELRAWPEASQTLEAPLPNLKRGPMDPPADSDLTGASGVHKILEEIFGKGNVEAYHLGENGNLERVHFGPVSSIVGPSPFDKYAINRMKWNDAPAQLSRMLEVPAYCASTPDHFPSVTGICISLLSFYGELLIEARDAGHISQEQAEARLAEVERFSTFCNEQIDSDLADVHDEWPMTAELWSEPEASLDSLQEAKED